MCAIAGILDSSARAGSYDLTAAARAMADAIGHRGPDDEDVWTQETVGLALSHRRLSITDLSRAGHQPMISSDGHHVIIFNGAVYNFRDIRRELEARGIRFRGHSDTEVVLESCAAFGVKQAVERLIGMFAFALWDRETRTLALVRDRLGIKPLYWAKFGGLFLFASQPKALLAHDGWRPQIDRDAVAGFLRHGYIAAPMSIFKGVRKLEPGCILTFGPAGDTKIDRYWDSRQVVTQAVQDRLQLSDAEAVDELESLLKDAVGGQMIADVPFGAFLSGGIDSSTIVALMQAQSDRPVRSFSIGFSDEDYDESKYAKAVAAHLGTEHTQITVEPDHALHVVPSLQQWYDEPFADPSQIPTLLLSELSRSQVTVALSGDGGDELFAGYSRYRLAEKLWARMSMIPLPLRRAASGTFAAIPVAMWDCLIAALPTSLRSELSGHRLHKGAALLRLGDDRCFYRELMSHWTSPDCVVLDGHEPHGILWDEGVHAEILCFEERMQMLDLVSYLPDDVLTKVDRASMAVALETRVPLLDHRVLKFAFRLPQHLKYRSGQNKWLLRQVLYRYVPRALVDRPKKGFSIPIGTWLRGPLREWAESLLDERALANGGLLDPAPVRRVWREHLSGRRNWQHQLWDVLMLEAWRSYYRIAA